MLVWRISSCSLFVHCGQCSKASIDRSEEEENLVHCVQCWPSNSQEHWYLLLQIIFKRKRLFIIFLYEHTDLRHGRSITVGVTRGQLLSPLKNKVKAFSSTSSENNLLGLKSRDKLRAQFFQKDFFTINNELKPKIVSKEWLLSNEPYPCEQTHCAHSFSLRACSVFGFYSGRQLSGFGLWRASEFTNDVQE